MGGGKGNDKHLVIACGNTRFSNGRGSASAPTKHVREDRGQVVYAALQEVRGR